MSNLGPPKGREPLSHFSELRMARVRVGGRRKGGRIGERVDRKVDARRRKAGEEAKAGRGRIAPPRGQGDAIGRGRG